MPQRASCIDPGLPIDPQARREMHRAAWRRWNRNPINALIFGIGLVGPIFLFPWISNQYAPVQSWTGIPAFLITFLTYTAYIGALSLMMKRWRYAPLVYAELRERGYDICPKCGYWLRDLDETIAHCPECGRARAYTTE